MKEPIDKNLMLAFALLCLTFLCCIFLVTDCAKQINHVSTDDAGFSLWALEKRINRSIDSELGEGSAGETRTTVECGCPNNPDRLHGAAGSAGFPMPVIVEEHYE